MNHFSLFLCLCFKIYEILGYTIVCDLGLTIQCTCTYMEFLQIEKILNLIFGTKWINWKWHWVFSSILRILMHSRLFFGLLVVYYLFFVSHQIHVNKVVLFSTFYSRSFKEITWNICQKNINPQFGMWCTCIPSFKMVWSFTFTPRLRCFHLNGEISMTGEGLQNLGLCSALRAFEQGWIIIMPHLPRHGASVIPVSS
jgi:hypothetical protein